MNRRYKGSQKDFDHYFHSEVQAAEEFEEIEFPKGYLLGSQPSKKRKTSKNKKQEEPSTSQDDTLSTTESFEDPLSTSLDLLKVNPHSTEFKKYVRSLKKTLLELKDRVHELKSVAGNEQLNQLLGIWTIEMKPEESRDIPKQVLEKLEALKKLKRKLAREREREKEKKWRLELNEKLVL
jgi:hypothetical protein